MDEESISKRVNEFGKIIGKEFYKAFMDSFNNFDEMPVDEAIKFLDAFNLECEKECPEFSITSNDCDNGCLFVKAVNTIKKHAVVNVTGEELENIKAEMCDDYCCKRKEWTGDPDELIDTVCADCPLTQL